MKINCFDGTLTPFFCNCKYRVVTLHCRFRWTLDCCNSCQCNVNTNAGVNAYPPLPQRREGSGGRYSMELPGKLQGIVKTREFKGVLWRLQLNFNYSNEEPYLSFPSCYDISQSINHQSINQSHNLYHLSKGLNPSEPEALYNTQKV